MTANVTRGGSDPWPFTVPTESASALFNGMISGKQLLVLDPAHPVAPADFNPDRIQITVDGDRKILSAKLG